jgi:hypothetical protein
MTTLELQIALLAHYNKAMARVQEAETFEDAKQIVRRMRVRRGVCYCAWNVFDEYLGDWVNRYANSDKHWGPKPDEATTKEEIIERLQLRIDILTKEINNHDPYDEKAD